MENIAIPQTPAELFEMLKVQHPYLLRLLFWQNGRLVLDSHNPQAKLDRETNLLKIFANMVIRVMPFMRSPLRDFYEDLKNVRSVTKSIISLLAGIVFGDEITARLDDPIRTFLPEITHDDPKATIKLKHLLSNTSGLPTIDDLPSMRKLLSTQNWCETILRLPLQDQPGKGYFYSSANFHLVACILERTLGNSLYQFAQAHLFLPLGIQKTHWACDPQGVPFGGSDLYLRAEDMLSIGRLCLQDGSWNGQQIVPHDWLKLSTQPIVSVDEKNQYGYGWWIDHNFQESRLHSFSACGVGGQRIMIIPAKNAVVVTTSLTSLNAHSNVIDDRVITFLQGR